MLWYICKLVKQYIKEEGGFKMNKKINALRDLVIKKNETLEYNTCTIKGVKNLSRSDRDIILMYLDDLELNGRFTLMISGGAGEVLKKAGLLWS